MSDNRRPDPPTDGEIVAYLDAELEPADRATIDALIKTDETVRARVDGMRRGDRDFRSAFDLLLDAAPAQRLSKMMAAAQAGVENRRPRRRNPSLIAAGVAVFVLGVVAGYVLPPLANLGALMNAGEEEVEPPNWRAVVSEYLQLYTTDTLTAIPDNAATRAVELQSAGTRLDLFLDPAKVTLNGLILKRAETFELRGMPLAHIAYLSGRDGVVALCIIKNGQPDAGLQFEQRVGKNIVFWQKGGRGYMVIGATPRRELEVFASTLASRFS